MEEVLSQCPELEHVDLRLRLCRMGKRAMESLTNLASLGNIEFELYAIYGYEFWRILDNGFCKKITSLKLSDRFWDRKYIAAMGHAIDVCQNLTEFCLDVFLMNSGVQVAMASLSRLFGNKERSMRLRKLWLHANLSDHILNAIFENCLGLELLHIASCGALNDGHLIEWARRGARPMTLFFADCDGISDRGIIPILKNSGRRLKEFRCYDQANPSKVTKLTWITCFEYCRYACSIGGYKNDDDGLLADARASKCFL